MQPVLQDRVAVLRVSALAAIDVVRNLRSLPDGVAQGFQSAERGLFGIRLGETASHRRTLRRHDENGLSLALRQGACALFIGP